MRVLECNLQWFIHSFAVLYDSADGVIHYDNIKLHSSMNTLKKSIYTFFPSLVATTFRGTAIIS